MASTIQTFGRFSAPQVRSSLLFVLMFWVTGLLIGVASPASASSQRVVIEMSVADPSQHRALIAQAESLASDKIRQAFQQAQEVSKVSLTILGSQNGNVIPILTTTVSRAQWGLEPDVKRWTKYENVYALFRGPEFPVRPTVVAAAPRRVFQGPQGILTKMDGAFDQGALPVTEVHRYLDRWD